MTAPTDRKLGTNKPVNRGNAGKGRPKGVPNKLTQSAKEAFQLAFDRLGGADGLARWASKAPDEFYKLYARLIPVDTKVEGGVTITIKRGDD